MKFFAIVALVATTQATASAVWTIADPTDGCAEDTYSCAVSSCTDGDPAVDGSVCVPNATVTTVDKLVKDIVPAPTAPYDDNADCKTAAICTAPEAAASALVASAAALATALYTLA